VRGTVRRGRRRFGGIEAVPIEGTRWPMRDLSTSQPTHARVLRRPSDCLVAMSINVEILEIIGGGLQRPPEGPRQTIMSSRTMPLRGFDKGRRPHSAGPDTSVHQILQSLRRFASSHSISSAKNCLAEVVSRSS
jgi:hypothetical protein